NGTLSIGTLEGNLFSGIALRDVALALEDQQVISIGAIELHYNLWQLATDSLTIDELILDRPRLALSEGAQGWNVARLIKKQAAEADREGPSRPLAVDRVEVRDGQLSIARQSEGPEAVELPESVEGLSLVAAISYVPVDITVDVSRLAFRTTNPTLE